MFTLLATDPDSQARLGRLTVAHGVIETPVFMPVGTQATVKCVSPRELRELDAQIILANSYHLFIRPGLEVIGKLGGLHRFESWERPILTDSGGFQVFSLAKLRKVTDHGVHFQSHIDGAKLFIGPREAVHIQRVLGSDIMMAFDECPPWDAAKEDINMAVQRTVRWAKICAEEWAAAAEIPNSKLQIPIKLQAPNAKLQNADGDAPANNQYSIINNQLLFGIVQGGSHADLRRECAEQLAALDLPGYAIGGVSVGEPEEEMLRAVDVTVPALPVSKPRYAMGLGQPRQIVEMVRRGVDMFDCVLPTRVARNGTAYTRRGTLNLKRADLKADAGPIEDNCGCYACQNFSRAYIRHLLKAGEILGLRLVTLHNLHFYLDLPRQIRTALAAGDFGRWSREFLEQYKPREDYE
ncbi:MAG: tRNA guanosine(34) transglycosylase Tgt [Verrucomicrobiales bacterium]|jgi:queuine tRNA-ribosyltransferase|nr:tRNA guanosine(34) transglycosylase Tgt [Verrucomicrobiales bacterium]